MRHPSAVCLHLSKTWIHGWSLAKTELTIAAGIFAIVLVLGWSRKHSVVSIELVYDGERSN